MSKDWTKIAGKVERALAKIGDTSQPNGYPATLRKPAGSAPLNPWDPPGGTPTYHQVIVMVADKEIRDASGTLIGVTRRTVTISGAAGVTPTDDDKIYLGAHLTYVDVTTDEGIAWQEIQAVRELAPAGVAVLFECDLAT